jgi:hypothetical protein
MSTFLKKGELQLINGGYLSDKKGNPVNNAEFVKVQQHAEYVVTFAEFAKGKSFVDKKADSLADLQKEVREFLYSTKPVEYVTSPEEVARPLTQGLAKEALAFIEYQENSSKATKINNFLQKFNVLNDFEKFGLFFEQGITKLNRIYTLEEIKTAVTEVIDLLD